MIAYTHTDTGTLSTRIKKVNVKLTETQEEKMWNKFHKECRVIEWQRGCTYSFMSGARFIKSNSLDEIQEMWKAHYNNLPIPERRCYTIKKKTAK